MKPSWTDCGPDASNRLQAHGAHELADDDANWRPTDFHNSFFGYEIVIRF